MDPNNIVELIDGGDHNPYHLFIYMLANFRTSNPNKPLIYYYAHSKSKLAEETLALLPSHFTRHTEKHPNCIYRSYLHAKPWFPDWTLPDDYTFLRSLFAPHISKTIRQNFCIYVSRNRDALSRRVTNEDALLQTLIPLNFIPVTLTDLSVKEQMQLFSQADVIVCPHGAGMSFMIFSNPAATIIELNSPSHEKRHYSHIAWHLDLDYYKISCDRVNDKEDMEVPVDRLCAFLKAHPKFSTQ